jgi:hypothetical protein
LAPEEARLLAERLTTDRDAALDTLAREELGLDPEALGPPWSAAISSMISFAVDAAVALVPYLVAAGAAVTFLVGHLIGTNVS